MSAKLDPEIFLGTNAILLPDMNDSDWEAECKKMFERQIALSKFTRIIKGEVVEEFNIDDFLDTLEHYELDPGLYCKEVGQLIEEL